MDEKVEVYEFRGRYLVARDCEVFELTDSGCERIEIDYSRMGPVMVDLGPLFFVTPENAETIELPSPQQQEMK